MDKMKWVLNEMPKSSDKYLPLMALREIEQVRSFHRSFPQYTVTPLANLAAMANRLGVGGLFVKDESYRFGLNAFKVLGGSFAMARYIAGETGRTIADMTYEYMTGAQLLKDFGQATFFTATDGNHGRGVAWAARKLGQKAVVHMPRDTVQMRFDNVAKEGAKVTIDDLNYDDCVRLAAAEAAQTEHGIVLQDTAWKGYEEAPSWIMQGYGTLVLEAAEQLRALAVNRPTHVFVQAGVGCLAGAVVGFFANLFPACPPKFIVMEAENAACLYQGACRKTGESAIVTGDLETIMAGLACGEPNIIGWDILRNHADAFLACPDGFSARGMRMLAAPLRGDPAVTSGESGAVGMGVLDALMTDPAYQDLRQALSLDRESQVLLISTEGDTDPDKYRRIVWGGEYPTEE